MPNIFSSHQLHASKALLYLYVPLLSPPSSPVPTYVLQSGSRSPAVHCKLPTITTIKPSPMPILTAPYLYACLILNPFNSATHVLTVVKQPQNPSIPPCSTWQPTRVPAPTGACCRSKNMPSIAVPSILTAKVPSGKDCSLPFRCRDA